MGVYSSFCLLIILSSYINIVVSQQYAVGKPLGPVGVTRSKRAVKTCGLGDMGPKCADCNTLLTCIHNTEVASQSCSTINSKQPYCVNDACAATTTELCISESFRCTGEGQFPDPHDCTRYFLCDSAGGNAYAYACPAGFSYDSKTAQCKRGSCQTIDCSKSPNQYVVFSADPSIMAYCHSTSTRKEVILFRCSDPQNLQYSRTTLKCAYKCQREGRFADRLDCHSFYECYRNGSSLRADRQTCPTNYSYDQVSQICEKRPNCSNEIGGNEEIVASGGGTDSLFFY